MIFFGYSIFLAILYFNRVVLYLNEGQITIISIYTHIGNLKKKINMYNTFFRSNMTYYTCEPTGFYQILNGHQNPVSHLLHQLLSPYHREIYIHRH